MFFQQLYNMADAMIVGRFVGKEALSAVGGSTWMLTKMIVEFFIGLTSGTTVVLAQHYGAKQSEQVSRAVHTSISFSIVLGAALATISSQFLSSAIVGHVRPFQSDRPGQRELSGDGLCGGMDGA